MGKLADGILNYSSKLIYTDSDLERTVGITNSISSAIIGLATAEKVAAMQNFITVLENLANGAIEDFRTVFISDETKEKIYTAVSTLLGFVKTAADTLASNYEYISLIFASLFSSLSIAISSGISDLKSDAETLANNVISGMANSFENGKKTVVEAYGKVNKAVKEEGNRIWDTKSPSKETYKLGQYIILGTVNGLLSKKNDLVQTYNEINEETEEGAEETFSSVADNLSNTAKDTLSEFSNAVTEENKNVIDNIKTFFSNLKNGVSDYTSEGMDWIKGKFDEFLSQYTGEFNGTNWMNLVLGTGGNPFIGEGMDSYYDQLQNEFENWLNQSGYELPITPVLTDENGNEITDWQSMLGGSSGGSLGRTVAGYTAEDVRNLTLEIYHLEDALYSLKEAMKDQQVTHSGELTIHYSNESDFVDRIQTAIIGEIRREVRG